MSKTYYDKMNSQNKYNKEVNKYENSCATDGSRPASIIDIDYRNGNLYALAEVSKLNGETFEREFNITKQARKKYGRLSKKKREEIEESLPLPAEAYKETYEVYKPNTPYNFGSATKWSLYL